MKRYFFAFLCFFVLSTVARSQTPTNVILDTGSVGIGTLSPAAKLHVVGNFDLAGNMDILADNFYLGMSTTASNFTYSGIMQPSYGLQWAPDPWLSGTATAWLSGYGGLKFFSNNTMQMYIDYNGRLGIGASGGTDKVNIATTLSGGETISAGTLGNSIFSGGHEAIFKSSNYTGGLGISVGANNSGFIQAFSSTLENGNLFLNPNGGSVGIGTTTPQSMLAVAGTVTAQQVTVTQAGWPDFVFDSCYQTMPLDKVAAFVRAYRHLPGSLSASQIEASGLDLGAMEKLHMQKIEEMTLYLIDADKHAKEQDRTISQQKAILIEQQALLGQLQTELKVAQGEIEDLKLLVRVGK